MADLDPLAVLVSDEARFELHQDGRPGHGDNLFLVMIPHGHKIGDDEVSGWSLTPSEVSGLGNLLSIAAGLQQDIDAGSERLMKEGHTSSTWTRGSAPEAALTRLVEGAPGEFHVYFCQTDVFPMTLDWWASGVPQGFMSRFQETGLVLP